MKKAKLILLALLSLGIATWTVLPAGAAESLSCAGVTEPVFDVTLSMAVPGIITVQQFNESAGGQVVFHLHMHVMPRHDGVALLPPASRKEDVKVLEDNATKLVAALG